MNGVNSNKNHRASILIVAVGVLAVLSLMAITFALVSRTELSSSRTLTDRQIAEFAAQQGVSAAVEILAKDDPRFDDFQEAWFTPPCPDPLYKDRGVGAYDMNRTEANEGIPAQNPYHRLVYNDGVRRACYDLKWHINEDPRGDDNGDGYPGIQGIDDDGDGKIDEDSLGRTPGDPLYRQGEAANSVFSDDESADQRYAMGMSVIVDKDGFLPDLDGRPGAGSRPCPQ